MDPLTQTPTLLIPFTSSITFSCSIVSHKWNILCMASFSQYNIFAIYPVLLCVSVVGLSVVDCYSLI